MEGIVYSKHIWYEDTIVLFYCTCSIGNGYSTVCLRWCQYNVPSMVQVHSRDGLHAMRVTNDLETTYV